MPFIGANMVAWVRLAVKTRFGHLWQQFSDFIFLRFYKYLLRKTIEGY